MNSAPTSSVGRTWLSIGAAAVVVLSLAALAHSAWLWLVVSAFLAAGAFFVAARIRTRRVTRNLEAIARGASSQLPFPWRTPKRSGLVIVRRKRPVRSAS